MKTLLIFVFLSQLFFFAVCKDLQEIEDIIDDQISIEMKEEAVFQSIHRNSTKRAIVGGEEVEKGRYPYMVALINCNGFQFCGGSLINEYWVLSAAHCKGSATHVHIGRHDLADISESFERIEIDFERKHPFFIDGLSLNKDFLLIKLMEKSSYQPVKLDSGTLRLSRGLPVTAIGWGHTMPNSLLTDQAGTSILHEVELNIVPNTICSLSYDLLEITPNMMCAKSFLKDSCYGDSGGPLIIKGETADEDIQVGITSFGKGCANPLYPGVYARVSRQSHWIKRVSSEDHVTLLKRLQYRFETWVDKMTKPDERFILY